MQSVILINLKTLPVNLIRQRCLNRLLYSTSSTSIYNKNRNQIANKVSFLEPKLSLYTVVCRNSSGTETGPTPNVPKVEKKQSKFKQFYSQYGPLFIVVHLTTVVMWIYGLFLISKQ